MGTALTAAETTEWTGLLRDMPTARRGDLVRLLAAAPALAAHKAYTVDDLKPLTLDEVQECVQDVVGFRKADVHFFMKHWKLLMAASDDGTLNNVMT